MGANQPPIQVQAQLRLECRYGLCSIEIYSVSDGEKTEGQTFDSRALGFSSSEIQGQIKGARESLNGRKNIYGTKKSKERREEPLGTMSYQTSSKRSPPFWLLIGARKLVFFLHQSEITSPDYLALILTK